MFNLLLKRKPPKEKPQRASHENDSIFEYSRRESSKNVTKKEDTATKEANRTKK